MLPALKRRLAEGLMAGIDMAGIVNLSVDPEPHLQEAASPQVAVRRSFSRRANTVRAEE